MKSKKTIIISAVFPPEPIVSAKLSFDIANALSFNKNVFVFVPKPSRPFGYKFNLNSPIKNNFKLVYANSFVCPHFSFLGRLKESFSFGYSSYKYIKQNYNLIDKIYANTWPLFAQFFVVYGAKKFNIPIVLHIQDIYPESLLGKLKKSGRLFNNLLLPLDKYILRNSTKIVAISHKMKNYLCITRNISPSKIAVVYNWQNEEEFTMVQNEECKEETNIFTFMYLGNIGPVAGLDLLIDSFEQANLINARLVIAGSGSVKNQLIEKAKQYSNFQIEFWDVPEGQVAKTQSKANVMLLPIKKGAGSSSIPSKLPAYMLSSKPVIACVDKETDTAEAIINCNCGWVVEPQNIEKLASKMKEVTTLSEDELREKGKNGFNYAIENFSKSKNLPKMISIINTL